MSSFADRYNKALKVRNMKQSTLSYKTKISEATLSHYAAGHYAPKDKNRRSIAKALRVSEFWLAGHDVPMFYEPEEKDTVVPVVGKVAAGIPIDAIEYIIDYEQLSPDMVKDGAEYFGLKIAGDSMEPRIYDGDIVIVRKQPRVENGQIGVICIDREWATCKKIIHYPNGMLLQPLNPAHEPVFYTNEEINSIPVTTIGRVIELRAKF